MTKTLKTLAVKAALLASAGLLSGLMGVAAGWACGPVVGGMVTVLAGFRLGYEITTR